MNGPVDVRAVIRAVIEELRASENTGCVENLMDTDAAVAELIVAGHRADGDERPARPERGPGYSDAGWEVFLRGWNAHAEAVYSSGLRAALARVGAK